MNDEQNMNTPQFHTTGDEDSHFYVLAFHNGSYRQLTQGVEVDAFLILNYSPSEGLKRFSFEIRSTAGKLLAFRRSIKQHPELAVALIEALYEYEIEPHQWSLYPDEQIRPLFQDEAHFCEYNSARNQLGSLLHIFRSTKWLKAKNKVTPLILLAGSESMIDPFEETAENAEVRKCAEIINQQYLSREMTE